VAPHTKGKMSAMKQTKFYAWRNSQGYPGLSTMCRSQCEEAVLHFKLMKAKDIPNHTVKEMTALIRRMDDAEIQEILKSKSREQVFTKSSSNSSTLTEKTLKHHEKEESQKVKLPCPEDDENSSIAESWDHHLLEALHFLLSLKPDEAEEAAAMMLHDMRELGEIHVNTRRKIEVLQLIYQLNMNLPQVGLYNVRGFKQTNPEKPSKEPEKTSTPAKTM
jgi:lysyl-tRNA synthetase class I